MSGFGDTLKETREARGLSLEAVGEATRIAKHHLAALERSDIAALPAGPFAKGYIEAYGKLLGIEPGPILEAYHAEARQRGLDTAEARSRTLDELTHLVEQRAATGGRPGRRVAGWKGLAMATSTAGLLAIGGWLVTRDRTPDAPVVTSPRPPAPVPPGPADAPEVSPSATSTPQEPIPAREVDPGAAPSPEPTPTPERAASVANPNIEIPDSGVGTGVESHRLVGQGDRFPEGSEVVFWTRAIGGDPGDVIHHVWLHEGRGIARTTLRLGGPHWRTYSRQLLPPGAAGLWEVEARGVDESVLARQGFLCVPPER